MRGSSPLMRHLAFALFLLPALSFAVERPVLENGYRPPPEYFNPVLQPGDTCRAGYTCTGPFTVADVDTAIPVGFTTAQTQAALNDPAQGPYYSLPPGYERVTGGFPDGSITLGRDCSVIQGGCALYLHSDSTTHPHLLADNEKAWLRNIRFDGAKNWTFYRLAFKDPANEGTDMGQAAIGTNGSQVVGDDITVAWVECNKNRFCVFPNAFGAGSANNWKMQRIYAKGHDPLMIGTSGKDFPVFHIKFSNQQIVRNTIIDGTDAVVLSDFPNKYSGIYVIQNTLEQTQDSWQQAANGEWYSCSENAVDIKAGGPTPAEGPIVERNIILGWRPPLQLSPGNPLKCGSGAGSGAPIITHFNGSYATIRENYVQGHDGFQHPNRESGDNDPQRNTVSGNVFDLSVNIPVTNTSSGYAETRGNNDLIGWNTFKLYDSKSSFRFSGLSNHMKYNLLIDSSGENGSTSTGDVRDYNGYVDGTAGGDTDKVTTTSSDLGDFTIQSHFITGPQTHVIPDVRPTTGSALGNWVASQAGQPDYDPAFGVAGGANVRHGLTNEAEDATPGALSAGSGMGGAPSIPTGLSIACPWNSGSIFDCSGSWSGGAGEDYNLRWRINAGAATTISGVTSPHTWLVIATAGATVDFQTQACEAGTANCSNYSSWAATVLSIGGTTLVPVPNRNGYTAEYQIPITLPGQSVDPNWAGTTAYGDTKADPTSIPDYSAVDCSGPSGTNDSGPNYNYVIRDSGGVSELESATPRHPIAMCVGDYRGATSTINIDASGTAQTDAGLIKVVCISPDNTQNPMERVANPYPSPFKTNHDSDQECLLSKLDMEWNDYWLFHNVTFHSPSPTSGTQVDLTSSYGTILDSVWVDCSNSEGSTSSSGGFCIRVAKSFTGGAGDGDYIWIQNSAIGPQAPYYNYEVQGISLHEFSSYARIVGNFVFDAGHDILTGTNSSNGSSVGNVIEDNDLANTPLMRLSDAGRDEFNWELLGVKDAGDAASNAERRFDPAGAHASLFDVNGIGGCTQAAMSIKMGSADPAKPLLVIHNRIHGARAQDLKCAGDGLYKTSQLITFQQNPKNTTIADNIIFDGRVGLVAAWANVLGADYSNLKITQNLFATWQGDDSADANFTNRSHLRVGPSCVSPCVTLPYDLTVEKNTFGPYPDVGNVSSDAVYENGGYPAQWDCNWMYDPNQTATGHTGSDNTVMSSGRTATVRAFPGLTNSVELTEAQGKVTGYTFWHSLRSGNPTQVTIPRVRWTSDSPATVREVPGCV